MKHNSVCQNVEQRGLVIGQLHYNNKKCMNAFFNHLDKKPQSYTYM